MKTTLFRLASAAALLGLTADTAPALTYDHLKCFKIADEHNYSAMATLTTNELQAAAFPDDTSCKISVRSKEFCIPVAKTRAVDLGNPKDAPVAAFIGQDLANDFICYKVRCDRPAVAPPASQVVHDQFGPRPISGLRTAKVCTPAVKLSGGPYDAPVPIAGILRQEKLTGSSPHEFIVDLYTSLDAEYAFTELTSLTGPAGISLSGAEITSRRDCSSGSVALGASGACNQIWSVRLTVAPGTCTLNGSYQATFRYGCNQQMPDCSLVDFSLPDFTVNWTGASADFCP
jgi:hypothetical protein